MAKILFGNLVADARGSVGGITYSRNAGGAYTKQKVSGVNPSSAAQQAQRANFGDRTKTWAILTGAQQTAWRAFAETHPVLNQFNNPVILSGIAMFTRLNAALEAAGLTIINNPPASSDTAALGPISLDIDVSDAEVNINFPDRDPIPATYALVYRITPSLSLGIGNPKAYYRQMPPIPAATADPFNAWTDYVARFGAPIATTRVWVIAHLIGANGFPGPDVSASAIVAA